MNQLFRVYAEQDQVEQVVASLDENNIPHSEIHDAVLASNKLNTPLGSPDLLVEMLKLITAVVQTAGAVAVLYQTLKGATQPGKSVMIVRESDGAQLEISRDTAESTFRQFVGR